MNPSPLEQAMIDELLRQHPEISGNPWLLESLIEMFRRGHEALAKQNEQLMAMCINSAMTQPMNIIHDSVSVDIPAAQLPPPREPMTPDRVLAALAKQPRLLLAVKEALFTTRVASKWATFNDSLFATTTKVGGPKGTLARFTPHGTSTVPIPVTKVHKALKPSHPNRHHLEDDYEWEQTCKEHEECLALIDQKPYLWRICRPFQSHFPLGRDTGLAETPEAAQEAVDEALRSAGWVLVSE
jgi:hypothetical protein